MFRLKYLFLSVLLFGSVAFADDSSQYLIDGNKYYQEYLTTQNKDFLEKAYLNYYKASQEAPSCSSYLGMGMVFMEKKMKSQAKNYLYKAYSIDENDPTANYYLAKFSYNNQEYLKSLDFFHTAYKNGLAQNYDVNYSIASIYEKIGEFNKAKNFYISAQKLNPQSQDATERLNAIQALELNKSKYGGN